METWPRWCRICKQLCPSLTFKESFQGHDSPWKWKYPVASLLLNYRLLWNRKWIKWSLGCMRYSTTGEKEAVALQVVKRVDLSQLQLKGLRNPVSRVSDLWTVAAFTLLKCISCYKMLPSFDDTWYCGVSTGTTIQMLLPVCYFEIFHF